MDLLTLAELMTLVRMLADLVGSIDKMNTVIEGHIARRLIPRVAVQMSDPPTELGSVPPVGPLWEPF